VIVFTAFADTAKYLYEHLSSWSQEHLGLHSALVTGGTDANKTTVSGLRRDIASILGAFSPISKERVKSDDEHASEIDLLISTDCLSEGQNLQDCDFLVNYDIHWNPVRIIQRFGRIDRLGSRNTSIQLVNFWPNIELDEYINLETRVSGRMVLLDISATGEENIIEYDGAERMNDLEYRRRQLEQLQHEVIDIEDLSNGISITDLTLSDFKIDLLEHLKEHTESLTSTPLGTFAVATSDELVRNENLAPGIIFCLQSDNQKVRLDSTYALAPYYLVYVTDQGEVRLNFTQTRQILDVFKKLTLGRQNVDEAGYARFHKRTAHGTEMDSYQKLLATAVAAITGRAEEKGIESLFERGGTAISKDSFRGIDDFEVITYLIVYDEESARV
ncbi:MAG: C-terminal helicase domain-containing protein, partial [Spirochaeta sp.]|nr:C-terminal helicase domain-containing protein [Spirochaeta sp.]